MVRNQFTLQNSNIKYMDLYFLTGLFFVELILGGRFSGGLTRSMKISFAKNRACRIGKNSMEKVKSL